MMFRSYESTSDSSSDSDLFFPFTFLGTSRFFMAFSSSKIWGVEDYDTLYTKQGKVDYFHKGLNFSDSWDEDDIILESCYNDEMDHKTLTDDSEEELFCM